MIKAIIFDMDGTVLDTEMIHLKAWLKKLRSHGYNKVDENYLLKFIGLNDASMEKIIRDELDPNYNIVDDIPSLRESIDEYKQTYGIEVKKGFSELNEFLDKLGLKKAIATSSPRKEAELGLKIAHIYDCFDTMVCGDEIVNGKPNPEIFLKAAESVATLPENCLVIEDSTNGVKSALNAGMKCVWIKDLITIERPLQEQVAVLTSLDEAIPLIKKLNGVI